MKALHVICGLPRSGSTMLCNILAQNPAFSVLHSSPLVHLLDQFCEGVTNVPEIKGMLANWGVQLTDEQVCAMARGMVEGLHQADKVCFDKSRFWNANRSMLARLYPEAQMFVCIRDLRAVFGSIERQWHRNPLLHVPPGHTTRARMQGCFAPDGIIGSALNGVEDLVTGDHKNIFVVAYEALAENPANVLKAIYAHLKMTRFEHDFEHVTGTAIDPDWLYLGKFPHEGTGKVQRAEHWREWVPPRLASEIMTTHQAYNDTFGYAA